MDPDIYICKYTKASRELYYDYMFVYVDKILVFSENTGTKMEVIKQYFTLKNNKYGEPASFPGAGFTKKVMKTGTRGR